MPDPRQLWLRDHFRIMTLAAHFPDLGLARRSGVNTFMVGGGDEPERLLNAGFDGVLFPLSTAVRPDILDRWLEQVQVWTATYDPDHRRSAIKVADEADDENAFGVYSQAADKLRGMGTFLFTNLSGDVSDPAFGYKSIEHLVKILNIGVDVVMVNQYLIRDWPPGFDFDAQLHNFFVSMNVARVEGILKGTPCFYWASTFRGFVGRYPFGDGFFGSAQVPNDSWLRWPVFVALTMGFQGIGWWPYDFEPGRTKNMNLANDLVGPKSDTEVKEGGRVVDPDETFSKLFVRVLNSEHFPSRLFSYFQQLNVEVTNIGKSLVLLKTVPDGLFYVSGDRTNIGSIPPGPGLRRYFTPHNTSPPFFFKTITIETPGHRGGLLGIFRDDRGTPYFMLMNLKQDGRSVDDAVHFTVELDTQHLDPSQFEDGVHLERLGRETGAVELVRLTKRPERPDALEITIPGGTGDLFKWADKSKRCLDRVLPWPADQVYPEDLYASSGKDLYKCDVRRSTGQPSWSATTRAAWPKRRSVSSRGSRCPPSATG